jgi:prepilin-type processing-associated H-X9-DG protein
MHSGVPRLYGLALATKPAQTIFAFDANASGANSVDDGRMLPRPARHSDGHGVLFIDAHVELMRNPDFAFGYDERVLKPLREHHRKYEAGVWRQTLAKQRVMKAKQLSTKAQTR